ncbi:ribonuclease H [Trifolium pratense]|uniref:Ribonuclease H n=1 Tax=Trifolium pratense TaxID=57577 RepID=A0A2K3N983_TRIPR|nr:ribonuclease H [Trifolium pratense]
MGQDVPRISPILSYGEWREEELTSLIKKHESRGDIHGVRVCRGAPCISHLLFADDCFLFFRANIREAQCMKNILNFSEVMGTRKYLGMPSMVGRSKKALFGYLKDRMWKRIQIWSGGTKNARMSNSHLRLKQQEEHEITFMTGGRYNSAKMLLPVSHRSGLDGMEKATNKYT